MIADIRNKTNRSSTSRQSSRKPSNNPQPDQIQKANFVTDFLKLCTDYDVSPLPQFHITGAAENFQIISENSKIENDVVDQQQERKSDELFSPELEEEISKSAELVTVQFNLLYDNQVHLDAPKDLRCKGSEVNVFMLDALNNCMKKFTTLTTLKLQRCSINPFGIVQISEILTSESGHGLKDLNLDGNPNLKQNYHLLCAPGINLLYLSLKACGINDEGVAKISSNLSHRDEPHAPKLIVINLANNHISENGGKSIGDLLRTNRSLQSLTLTGNRINDIGAECIINQLSTFTLTHEEVVEKRRRTINRLKLCEEKMDNVSRELASESEILDTGAAGGKERSGIGNRVLKKRRASSRQLISNSSESSINRSTPTIVQSLKENADAMIPIETHPLVKDVIPINGTLTCPGNFKLEHLNLSFNKIGEDTLRRIIECVKKQRSMLITTGTDSNAAKGLQYVDVIEGNEFEKSCESALQLSAIIRQRRSI